MAFDDLEEHGGTISDRLGEDLKKIAVFVAVDEDASLLQFLDRNSNLSDTRAQFGILVIRSRSGEKLDSFVDQSIDCSEDVAGRKREMLSAGTLIELEVFVDL